MSDRMPKIPTAMTSPSNLQIARLARLARGQFGVISRRQAVELGLSRSAITRRVRSGVWQPIYRGVFLIGGAPLSWEARLFAGTLKVGKGAVVSHRSAARLWGTGFMESDVIEMTVPNPGVRPPPGLILHAKQLPRKQWGLLGSFRITSPARTLIDLASVTSQLDLEDAVESALLRSQVSLDELKSLSADKRFVGAPALRKILALRGDSAALESKLELEFIRILRKARVPIPQRQHIVTLNGKSFRIDFAYPDLKLGIECDGYRYHAGRSAMDSDVRRANEFSLGGWSILHFTATDLKQPKAVVGTVVKAVQLRALQLQKGSYMTQIATGRAIRAAEI